MTTFTPEYVSLDFSTLLDKLKEELRADGTFVDYDYEGSNISVLLELMAYFGDQNTFFINKLAKNIFFETADLYEAVNMQARSMGYEAKGTRSARGTLTLTISGAQVGDIYTVYPWKQFDSGRTTDDEEAIKFCTTTTVSATASSVGNISIDVPIRQGELVEITGYKGSDLVSNELYLPEAYAYDDDLDDTDPSIQVVVDDVIWERISDFYDEIDPLSDEDNVYMLRYDKYEKSKIVFSDSRNIPDLNDDIEITTLDSLGEDGSLAEDTSSDEWTIDTTQVVLRERNGSFDWIDNDNIIVSLDSSTTAGASPETVNEVKLAVRETLHSQYRNVTARDYKNNLENRSDISQAMAWGEQDIAPSGSILEYNKVHLSVIPEEWGSGTINTSAGRWTTSWSSSGAIYVPTTYSTTWQNTLSSYLLPRKIISVYETFDLPQLIWFSFSFGVRIKRIYSFANVRNDILSKLIYYFRTENQDFNSIINFNDIIEFILDSTQVSTDDSFDNVKGIRNLNLRDIDVNKHIYEPNTIGNYPYYIESSSTYTGDNKLRKIQLGLNQFPVLNSGAVLISQET